MLAVLWLSVAMTAIARPPPRGVRSELDRASLNVDSTASWPKAPSRPPCGASLAPPTARTRNATSRPACATFTTISRSRAVDVEITGESGKLDVNSATAEALARVFDAARIDPAVAVTLAVGIVDYRERLRKGLVSYGLSPEELMAQMGTSGDPSSSVPSRLSKSWRNC
ncbi:MAG: hypothetical protein R2724_26190 [Bryobacterales bacterium]